MHSRGCRFLHDVPFQGLFDGLHSSLIASSIRYQISIMIYVQNAKTDSTEQFGDVSSPLLGGVSHTKALNV